VFGAAFIDRLAVPIASPGANGLVSSRTIGREDGAKNALCARKSATRANATRARGVAGCLSPRGGDARARTVAPENNK